MTYNRILQIRPATQRLWEWVRLWFEAWLDSRYAVTILLSLFVIIWTPVQIISFAPLNLHPDVLEVYAWSRHPSAGYWKHPPLGGLMMAVWFSIFPAADWAAHLFAMVNAALSLAVVDLICRRYISGDKRLMVLLLLLLTPFYQFHSVRFGSNQTLLLTWPLAVYCFIRVFETRQVRWAIAAGGAAALAMLGKYFSVFLVGGLVVTALLHPKRRLFFRSSAPWLSMAAGLVVLGPHLVWLHANGYQPFRYASLVVGAPSVLDAALTVPGYLFGGVGYIGLMTVVCVLATKSRPYQILAALWPNDPDRRLLAYLLWGPLLLPAIFAPLVGATLTSLWTMQAWFLLPILLLAPPQVQIPRSATVAVAAAVLAYSLGMLLISPALALAKHLSGTADGRAYYRALARELEHHWREMSARPLNIVLNDFSDAAVTFYAADHPDSVPNFGFWAAPWVTPERLKLEGFAMICRDDACLHEGMRLAAREGTRRVDVVVTGSYFGLTTPPAHYILFLAPPSSPDR